MAEGLTVVLVCLEIKMVAAGLTVVLVFPWDSAADWRGLLAAEIALLVLPPGTNFLFRLFSYFSYQPSHFMGKKLFSYFLFLENSHAVSTVADVNICGF